MQIIYLDNIDSMPDDFRCVCALGNFDGVHIAHASLMRSAIGMAEQTGTHSAVFTFESAKGTFLTTFDEKMNLIENIGIEYAFVGRFDSLKNLEPVEFIEKILFGKMHTVGCVCGFNFRFGRMAAGDTVLLGDVCSAHSAMLKVVEKVVLNGLTVSSTEIRRAVCEGRLDVANEMLGRPFCLHGRVTHGRGVGRTIAIPTINLTFPESMIVPKHGVYFVRAIVDGITHVGVCNVGVRPTFEEQYGIGTPVCEVHMLDNVGDVYGSDVIVLFDKFRRSEIKFDSTAKLCEQVAADTKAAADFYRR